MIRLRPRPSRQQTGCAVCLLASTVALDPGPAPAQTISVLSVDAGVPDLGSVVSASSGDTVFRISPDDGGVTKLSGAGIRIGNGMTRGHVVLTCTGDDACSSSSAMVTITQFGSPTGRALALRNFTIAPGIDPPTLANVTGADTLTFTVSGIPRDATRDLYIGADFTITDNGTSGLATAGFLVSLPAGAVNGAAQASALRALTLSKNGDLVFGTILTPSSGSGSVTLNAVDGVLNVTGTGARALASTTATPATYTVRGEVGQSFSIDMDIETPVDLAGPAILPVILNTNAAPSQILTGQAGDEGEFNFSVGGSFSIGHDTPAGSYSGTFIVTVAYN